MNPVQELFHQPWISSLGWTFLHFLWQGALIAALLSVARALAPRPAHSQFRYAASCISLAAMMAAPVVTFLLLANSGTAPNFTAASNAAHTVANTAATARSVYADNNWDSVSPWLGAAWLVGVMFSSLHLFGGWLATARLRTHHAKTAPEEWRTRLHGLMDRAGIDGPVDLLVSSLVESPAVIGWLRPAILVPVGALAGLPASHVEALLAHELAHIRRHDYFVNLLQRLAESLLFYHPAVWWVSAQIRVEREHCCDDAAIHLTGGDVLTYTRALAELEACRPAHANAMGANGASLRDRIRRLINPSGAASPATPARGAAWGVVVTVLVAAGIVASCSARVSAQEAQVSQQKLWPDTVKQGDLTLEVRGLGTLTSATTAEVRIAETQVKNVASGQPVLIDFRNHPVVPGRVTGIRPGVTNGVVTADIAVLGPLPPGAAIGQQIDATVTVGAVSNVVYVGRPVFGQADGEGTLFKIDPDGLHASRVKVQFGHASVNKIEIKSGLQPGDKVILNDMNEFAAVDRIALTK
jgi:beta-lactamase regulating signal transducer with metallopeptidase domain